MQEYYDKAKKAKLQGDMDEYRKNRDIAAGILKAQKSTATSSGQTYTGGNGNQTGNMNRNVDSAAEEIRKDREERKAEAQKKKEQEYDDAVRDMHKNRFERWGNLAGSIASTGIGLGMHDNIREAVTTGAIINNPVDVVVTGANRSYANKLAYEGTKDETGKGNEAYKTSGLKNTAKIAAKDYVDTVKDYLKVIENTTVVVPVVKYVKGKSKSKRDSYVEDDIGNL
ncbi:hypothetical protein D3C76_1135160 [compost metagenome]